MAAKQERRKAYVRHVTQPLLTRQLLQKETFSEKGSKENHMYANDIFNGNLSFHVIRMNLGWTLLWSGHLDFPEILRLQTSLSNNNSLLKIKRVVPCDNFKK